MKSDCLDFSLKVNSKDMSLEGKIPHKYLSNHFVPGMAGKKKKDFISHLKCITSFLELLMCCRREGNFL